TIKRTLRLTARQLDHLAKNGLQPKGRKKNALPGFFDRLAEEQTALRVQSIDAAKAVSSRGVAVLSNAMEQSIVAQDIIGKIQRLIAEQVDAQLALPPEQRSSLDAVLPGDGTMKALSVLHRISNNYYRAARSLREIYGSKSTDDHPAHRAKLNITDQDSRAGGTGHGHLLSSPAAVEMQQQIADSVEDERIAEEIQRQILTWTPEERMHYALTGDEPKPPPPEEPEAFEDEDAIDVLAVETKMSARIGP